MNNVWIQVEGEESLFRVEVPEEAVVDDIRDAVIQKSNSLKWFDSTELVVYANKEAYERSQRGEETDKEEMEDDVQIRGYGRSRNEALFVTVSQKSLSDIRTFRYDGIDVTKPHISRVEIIDIIIESIIQRGQMFYVISSSAASGKTSLLNMIIARNPNIKFIYLSFLLERSAEDILKMRTGIDLGNMKCSLPFPVQTVICIDDAHCKYNETGFWIRLIKIGPQFIPKNVHFIFSAVFLFSTATESYTPAEFDSLPKIERNDLMLTNEKALEFLLLPGVMPKEWRKMSKLIDLIIKECNGLVGALKMSVAFLENRTEYYPMEQDEDQLISRFMSRSIRDYMTRCFGASPGMPPRERRVILLNMIFHPKEKICLGGIKENTEAFDIYSSLQKSGILAEKNGLLQFSSPIACRFYMKSLFPRRGNSNPSSIRELVRKVISGMSASVLRQSVAMNGDFPNEAVFQDLFMEHLAANTESTCAICPELSRAYPPGNEVIKGEIYLYLHGTLRWGLKLLMKGDRIGEHLKTFLTGEKHHPLQLNDWAIIDFRLKKQSDQIGIEKEEKRITVFFDPDYSAAECLFHNEDATVSFSLAK